MVPDNLPRREDTHQHNTQEAAHRVPRRNGLVTFRNIPKQELRRLSHRFRDKDQMDTLLQRSKQLLKLPHNHTLLALHNQGPTTPRTPQVELHPLRSRHSITLPNRERHTWLRSSSGIHPSNNNTLVRHSPAVTPILQLLLHMREVLLSKRL